MGTKLAAALAGLRSSPPEPAEDERAEEKAVPFECSDEVKLAAYEVMDALGTGFGGGGEDRVGKVAKALLAFVQIADAQPHKEGPHEGEA